MAMLQQKAGRDEALPLWIDAWDSKSQDRGFVLRMYWEKREKVTALILEKLSKTNPGRAIELEEIAETAKDWERAQRLTDIALCLAAPEFLPQFARLADLEKRNKPECYREFEEALETLQLILKAG